MKFQRKRELLATLKNIFSDCYELDFLNAEKAYRDKKADIEFKKDQLDNELLEFERERHKTYIEYSDWKQLIEEIKKSESIEDSLLSDIAEKIEFSDEILHPEEWKKKQEERRKKESVKEIENATLQEVSLTPKGGIEIGVTDIQFKDDRPPATGGFVSKPEGKVGEDIPELIVPIVSKEEVENKEDIESFTHSVKEAINNKENQALIDKAQPVKKKKPIFNFDPVVVNNKNVQLRKEVAERRKLLEDTIRKHPKITAQELRKTLGYGGGEDTRFNSDIRYLRETYLNAFLATRNIKDPPEKMAYSFDDQKKKDLNGYRDHNFTIGAITHKPQLKSDKNLY